MWLCCCVCGYVVVYVAMLLCMWLCCCVCGYVVVYVAMLLWFLRLERNKDREESVSSMEYLKNVILKVRNICNVCSCSVCV